MKMSTKRIGYKGELVIPKNIRQQQGLKPNSKVEIISTSNGILLVPLTKKLSDFKGLFGSKGVKDIKKLDILAQDLMYRI